MASDGAVVIDARMNTAQAEKDLARLKSNIEKTEDDIGNMQKKRDDAQKKSVFDGAELDAEKAKLEEMRHKLTQQEIEAKNAQITALNQQLFGAQLAASQTAQNQYLLNQLKPCPIPAYLTCSPYTTYNVAPVSLNGCNSGCGCGGYSVAA